jgi:hypothetical protein
MASIDNYQLKSIRKTTGKEGDGYTAAIYYKDEKLGTVCDYGEGRGLQITIPKAGEQVAFIFTAQEFVKKYMGFTDEKVKADRQYTQALFIEKLIELHDLEKKYKKSMNKHHTKHLVLADVQKKSDIVRPAESEPIFESVGTFVSKNVTVSVQDIAKEISGQGIMFDRINIFRSLKEFNINLEELNVQSV